MTLDEQCQQSMEAVVERDKAYLEGPERNHFCYERCMCLVCEERKKDERVAHEQPR